MLRNRCSLAGMLTAFALLQLQFDSPRITDTAGKAKTVVREVAAGTKRDLCLNVPDGTPKSSGTDIYRYYASRITGEVYAKNKSDSSWGKACVADGDSMACPKVQEATFVHSIFELEPFDAFSRRICWPLVNHSRQAVDAMLVVRYTLREVKNGFVSFSRKRGDRTPMTMTVQGDCVCSSDGHNVTAYVGRELKPSSVFFAKHGDIIELKPAGKGQQLGIPDGCSHELNGGTYHLKIEGIYPFEQPAVYKTILQGQITREPLTDVSKIFGHP